MEQKSSDKPEERARHQWIKQLCVCQRQGGEFRGSSAQPWSAAAAVTLN